jgi:hypothetical protein
MIWMIVLCLLSYNVSAQTISDSLVKKIPLIVKKDSVAQKKDTVFKHEDIAFQGHDTIIHKRDSIYRRALAEFDASSIKITNDAVRAYASPSTFSHLVQDMNGAYPLIQTDEDYGRESFEFTNRISEPLAASFLEGVLPLNDPITGNTVLNYFPLEIARMTTIENGGMLTAADHGSSDAVDFTLERFRAPIAYSRFHFTQESSNDFVNFEGLFSINPSEPLNIAFAVYHRSAGTALVPGAAPSFTFNPFINQWWVRGQSTYDTKVFHALLFMFYTSAFSGVNGGVISHDTTTDFFDQQLSTVRNPSAFDHRTRFDVLGQIGLSLFSDKERTLLSAYGTTSARAMIGADSTFPAYYQPLSTAQRYGLSLIQPAELQLGSFITRATIRGDAQYLSRHSGALPSFPNISETRLSALGSDSISIASLFGISVSGYFRETVSALSLSDTSVPSQLLTNFGLEASAKLTEALKFTAQLTYAKDRASLSPTPTALYEIKNVGAFLNLNVPFGAREKFSLALGYLDRHEPEGVILQPLSGDSVVRPIFSSTDLHTGSIRANMDVWFSYFRYQLYTTFFPSTIPKSSYTSYTFLQSNLNQRIQSSTGIYYENEIAEGNLRMSFGVRVRYMNTLSPSLTYDPFSDYYVYRGREARIDTSSHTLLNDPRLTQPKYILDILVSTTVDQRATVNLSFLNILGTPYYNVAIYPRGGFQFRLDVTWAFLD